MSGPQRREQLLSVARPIFAEKGFEATSIEEIADRADVSKPVVYQHFGGKEGLYAVIVDREVADLMGRITAAFEVDHPRLAVQQVTLAFLTYIEDEADGFRILVRDAPLGMTGGTLASVMGEVAEQAQSMLATQFKARGFERKLAPMYARSLVGMVAMVGEWWLDARKPKKDVVAAHLVNLMWNGLKDLDPDPEVVAASDS